MLMTTMIYLKALGVWVLFAGAALVCRMVLDQSLMVYFVRWTGPTPVQALLIGLLWLLRTVLADVVFVHYVLGTSWSALVADYNLGRGRGALVFVIQAVSPYLLTKRAPCFS